MRMPRAIMLAILAVTLEGAPPHPARAASPAPKQALQTTLADLSSSKQKALQLEKQLKATNASLEKLRENATALAAQVQSAEAKADAQKRRYQTITEQLATKEKEYATRKQAYAHTLSTMLRMREMPTVMLMADHQHTQTMLRTARVMQEVNAALAKQAAALKKEMTALQALKADAQQSKIQFERAENSLAQKQTALKKDLTARQTLHAKLAKDHAATQARVAQLSRTSRNLQDLIQKLAAQRPNIATTTRATLPTTAQGSWQMPILGKILHRFGTRKNANETYRGIVLQGRAGGTVIAPASGEVVFTGPFRDYGPMVLIKHGKQQISLLAGLGTISVSLNQTVGRGEPVGRMRNSGAPELYVELRHASKPVDPARWFGKVK